MERAAQSRFGAERDCRLLLSTIGILTRSRIAAVLPGVVFGQVKSDRPVKLTPCADAHRTGRRIVSNLDIVEFRVPRSAPVTKANDSDYVVYGIRYDAKAENLWLKMMFGLLVGGQSPHDLHNSSIKWTATKWSCSGIGGDEWRGTAEDGRRWRHIAIPMSGFAAYEGVPTKAADYFDKILDTMCCGKCRYCGK